MSSLETILAGVEYIQKRGCVDQSIVSVKNNSALIKQGDLFVAVKGTVVDGHDYIQDVVEKGAKAVVCQQLPEKIHPDICYIQVKDSRIALAECADNYYNHAAGKLKIIGITGTNGKTTVATMLYQLFNKANRKTGLISTVAYYIGNKKLKATHTTPDALSLHELFFEMVQKGCEYCFMEVSSHAIDQKRIHGIEFRGAVFTNLTHEHLDYHKTFQLYRDCKKQLFDNLSNDAFALVNIDDKNGNFMLQNCKAKHYRFAMQKPAEFKTKIIEQHLLSTLLEINYYEVWTKFSGAYNASNLTAVYACSIIERINREDVLTLLSDLNPVAGRFETIELHGITGIIDYAHTPDALKKILKVISEIKKKQQHLIAVVGAGGDRDKTKRPIMAKIAMEYSDKVILTSDNPRTESPVKILDDMERGIEHSLMKNTLRIIDRKEAIKTACLLAKVGDIILIAGKGHEDYQEINGLRSHFNDKEIFIEQMEVMGDKI